MTSNFSPRKRADQQRVPPDGIDLWTALRKFIAPQCRLALAEVISAKARAAAGADGSWPAKYIPYEHDLNAHSPFILQFFFFLFDDEDLYVSGLVRDPLAERRMLSASIFRHYTPVFGCSELHRRGGRGPLRRHGATPQARQTRIDELARDRIYEVQVHTREEVEAACAQPSVAAPTISQGRSTLVRPPKAKPAIQKWIDKNSRQLDAWRETHTEEWIANELIESLGLIVNVATVVRHLQRYPRTGKRGRPKKTDKKSD